MKTIVKLIIVIFCITPVTSCVSAKKYAEAQNENQKYKNQLTANEANNAKLQRLNDSLAKEVVAIRNKLNEQMNQKQAEYTLELSKDQKMLTNLKKAVGMEQNEITGIKQKVCFALKCFMPDELSIKEKDGELYVSMYDKLLFPTGSVTVNNRGKEALKMLADVLKKDDMEIMVEGHTDAVPIHNDKFVDNWDLSALRATSVSRILIHDKIAPERIIAAGRSKYHPYDSNESEKGRKLNRRTDIVIVPKLEQLYSLINQNNDLHLNSLSQR